MNLFKLASAMRKQTIQEVDEVVKEQKKAIKELERVVNQHKKITKK